MATCRSAKTWSEAGIARDCGVMHKKKAAIAAAAAAAAPQDASAALPAGMTEEKIEKAVEDVMAEHKAALKPYEIEFARLERHESIGEGGFGTVFRGVLDGTTLVAIKTVRVSKIEENEIAKFKGELMVSVCLLGRWASVY